MKRTVITFGLISGAISSLMMLATVPFMDRIGFDHGYLIGYTAIILSFLLVFFGVRSYRDSSGGTITFGRAFTVGLLITLISCVFYVVTWEILYFNFMPDFMDKYGAYTIAQAKAAGATPEALQGQLEEIKKFKVLYSNPLINMGMTFLEPFPVGLVITLIAAAAFRRPAKP